MNLKKLTRYACIFLVPCLITNVNVSGQSVTDSSALAYAAARKIYFNSLGQELNLYNGVFYKGYPTHDNDEGQPYFRSENWIEGSINYDGVGYEDVPMLYDLVEDKIVIEDRLGTKMQLIDERLTSFRFNNHRFVRLTHSATDNTLENGFYEVLFDGGYKAYARWHKKRLEVAGSTVLQVRYEDQNKFYIFDGKRYIQVKSKSSVLNVLHDKKQILSKFIRERKLKFGANCGESLPKVLTQYESVHDERTN